MSVPGPVLGPCESWIDGADVAACCAATSGTDDSVFDTVAFEAAMALYEISGRLYTGLCSRTVRPAKDTCRCFVFSPSAGMSPWYWSASLWGGSGGFWRNECGDQTGCGTLSRVKLSGYPVREIVEVKIDGVALPTLDDNGYPNYRLDEWKFLTRLDDPGPPVRRRYWPACQNLALEADQPGTFEVSYRCGIDPPQLGRDAAVEIACQLYAACNNEDCQLPAGVTKAVRQGITIERGLLADWLDPKKPTGLVHVDLFLQAYWRGSRGGRRPAVFSPDVQAYARRLGGA